MTRILPDSHVLLWFLDDSPRLGDASRRLIHGSDAVHYSVASLWELEIKRQAGRLAIPQDLDAPAAGAGLRVVEVTADHIQRLADIELPHRDPFDRILAAQALSEGLSLLTADAKLMILPFAFDARE